MDKFLDFGLWLTARELQTAWLPALQAGTWNFDGNVQHLTFALQAVGSADVVGPLMVLLREGQLGPDDRTASVMGTVVLLGGSRELGELFDLVLAPRRRPRCDWISCRGWPPPRPSGASFPAATCGGWNDY